MATVFGAPSEGVGQEPANGSASSHVPTNTSTITDGTFANSQGRIGLNAAAGNYNAEANLLTISTGSPASVSSASAQQNIDIGRIGPSQDTAHIGAGAFAGASGSIAVNNVAGSGNAVANVAAIAFGINGVELADSQLEQNAPDVDSRLLRNTQNAGVATIDDTAFQGARGIVQVTQAAGPGNALANTFSLTVGAGAGD